MAEQRTLLPITREALEQAASLCDRVASKMDPKNKGDDEVAKFLDHARNAIKRALFADEKRKLREARFQGKLYYGNGTSSPGSRRL